MATRKKNASGGNSLLTLGLLAVGGYFVYEWFFAPSAAATGGSAPSGGVPSSCSVNFNAADPAVTTAAQAAQLLQAQVTQLGLTPAQYLTIATANPASVTPACMQALFPGLVAAPVPAGYPGGGASPTSSTSPITAAPTATSTSGTTLDAIYTAILSGAAGDPNFTGSGSSLTGSAYHFNVYLAIAAPNMTIPDPASVFGNATAADQPMTAAAYWAKMGPAMSAANAGLSGGLGAFAGIGAFMTGLGAYAWR